MGGLARRAGKIKEIRETHRNVLVLDCGDTFLGKKNVPELRAEAVLSGMNLMKYDAINVADGELSLGTEFFQNIAGKLSVPFISANIVSEKSNLSEIKPYILKDYGAFRVGITGVTPSVFFDTVALKKDGIVVKNYVKALKELMPELRKKADIIIFLSHLGYKGTLDLFRFNQISGIDVAIAGHGRKLLNKPEEINGTIVVQSSMGGEYLGKLVVSIGPDRTIQQYDGEVVALTEDIPVDKKVGEIMEEFKKKKHKTEETARNEKKRKKLLKEQTKYLKMAPQEFLEMMKKENEAKRASDKPASVPK